MNHPEISTPIAAVVATFNPDLSVLRDQISRTACQVAWLIVVDDGSSNVKQVAGLVNEFDGAECIALGDNAGVGHAHNVGIRRGLQNGARAVLILDQDTLPGTDMVSVLAQKLEELQRDDQRIAAVGARYLGEQPGHQSFFVRFRRLRFEKCFCSNHRSGQMIRADMLISSGTLFSATALNEIGDMEEGLFIDHVDTEWFLRAEHRNWRSYGVCDALMEHSLGERTFRVWLGRWRHLPVHKPFRYYYIYRNSVLLYRRVYPAARWKCADLVRLVLMAVVFLVFADHRITNLFMMCRGIVDGLRGQTGRKWQVHPN